jgi:hypothetical protein
LTGNVFKEFGGKKFSFIAKKIDTVIPLSTEGHLMSVKESLSNLLSAPVLGKGISSIEDEYKTKDDQRALLAEHNRYLYIVNTSGVLVGFFYILFILSLIFFAFKSLTLTASLKNNTVNLGFVLVSL